MVIYMSSSTFKAEPIALGKWVRTHAQAKHPLGHHRRL